MRRQRGFTLIEAIISLVILSMIMVAVMTALRTLANTRTTVEALTGRVDELRLVSSFIRDRVSTALPVVRVGHGTDIFTSASNHGTYFWGSQSELLWVGPVHTGYNFGGVYIFRLSHEGQQLILRSLPYQRDVDASEWRGLEGRVLLDDVEELSFSYRSPHDEEWQAGWSGEQFNPVAVSLVVKVGERYWPQLVMRLDHGKLNVR